MNSCTKVIFSTYFQVVAVTFLSLIPGPTQLSVAVGNCSYKRSAVAQGLKITQEYTYFRKTASKFKTCRSKVDQHSIRLAQSLPVVVAKAYAVHTT